MENNQWQIWKKKWDFPHCLGAIVGEHVTIKKSPQSR